MIAEVQPFDTNVIFAGGAGMFIQYHDVVKPVYLYAILKMIVDKESYGLPIDIISDMTVPSIIEWYIKRRYINPFRQLDYQHVIDPQELDIFLSRYLESDNSIYKLAPGLNIQGMMNVYVRQHMNFPVYIYTKEYESYVKEDCKTIFPGVNVRYLYGDLRECIRECKQNFTYIFSDIELVKEVSEILIGTCSHVLLASEYRYNYSDHCKTLKYDLAELARTHPFLRIGLTNSMNIIKLIADVIRIFSQWR